MRCLNSALLFCLFVAPIYGQPRQPNSIVQVEGRSPIGDRLDKVWAILRPVSGVAEYKASGSVAEFSVPTGEYILQLDAPGFESRRQLLRVYQPKVFRTVALPLARAEGPPYASLAGTIRNYEGDAKTLRVRLMALYGNELREATVDGDGTFGFPIDEGLYLLLVISETEKGIWILDSRPLRIGIGKKETIGIDLKGKRGEAVPK